MIRTPMLVISLEKARKRSEPDDPSQLGMFDMAGNPVREHKEPGLAIRPTSGVGRNRHGLVPKRVSVQRDGKAFMQTVWTRPGEDTASRTGAPGIQVGAEANWHNLETPDLPGIKVRVNSISGDKATVEYNGRSWEVGTANLRPKTSGSKKAPAVVRDTLPRAKRIDSRDDLEAMGTVNVTSIGHENVYFEKDGEEYYFKAGDLGLLVRQFAEGKMDMKAAVVGKPDTASETNKRSANAGGLTDKDREFVGDNMRITSAIFLRLDKNLRRRMIQDYVMGDVEGRYKMPVSAINDLYDGKVPDGAGKKYLSKIVAFVNGNHWYMRDVLGTTELPATKAGRRT